MAPIERTLVHDVVIIGGGPAGLSAALMLTRSRRDVVVVDAGRPRNSVTKAIHGYLTRDGATPRSFRAAAHRELEALDVLRVQGEATRAMPTKSGFSVRLKGGRTLRSRTLLLATGLVDRVPDIAGLRDLYGTSVHHCPYCDGYPWRDRRLAAYGIGRKAAGLAMLLRNWSDDVVAFVAGSRPLPRSVREKLASEKIEIVRSPIARLEGSRGRLRRVILENGDSIDRDAFFFNTPQAQRSPLAEAIGCEILPNGGVQVDRRGRTCVPGVYVVGDALRDVQFVVTAASDGAVAALAIDKDLRERDGRLL